MGIVSGPAQFKLLFFKGQLYFENGDAILFVPKMLKDRGMPMPSGETLLYLLEEVSSEFCSILHPPASSMRWKLSWKENQPGGLQSV